MLPQHEAQASSEPEGVAVPDHELIQCIGRGSYGEVWLARNLMGMFRAVKVVFRKNFGHQRPFERELAGIKKFEPISRSHESFVDILHVGQNEKGGYFYYIMELGDDSTTGQNINPRLYVPKTLSKEIALRGKLPLSECVQLGLWLSAALNALHSHGLVHRDVKPSNIIFVNGVPKLADIGLVADMNEARSYVGTEGFIPPEGPGSAQADIYSLGKVLYEISTGRDRHDFPELPTLLDQTEDLDRFLELNEVILHACKSDVRQRYGSAWDMHADLVVLSNGKSVKRLKLLEQRVANLRKIGGISAIVLVAVAAILFQIYREWSFAREGRQRQIGSEVAYGTRAMEEGDLLNSLPAFAEALHLDRGDAGREQLHRQRIRAVLAQAPRLVQMWFSDHEIKETSFSPEGKRVLIIESMGKARLHDVATGAPTSDFFGQNLGLAGGAWDASGQWVVTASFDGTGCVWDPKNPGRALLTLVHPDKVFTAVFSPDGSRIVTACKDSIARIWSFPSGKLELELRGQTDAVLHAAFSHDGKLVVTASRDNTAQIWNAATGKPVGSPLRHGNWVNRVAFSPDDRKVVTACVDHNASVWDVGSSRKILPVLKHGDAVMSAEFSPDGLFILTACLDGTARLWDVDSMQPVDLNPVLRHSSRLYHAAFAPDGHQMVTASLDGTTCVWDFAGNRAMPATFTGVASQDATRLLLKDKGSFRVLDSASLKAVTPAVQLGSPLLEARLSPNGRFAFSVVAEESVSNSSKGLVQVWDSSIGSSNSAPIMLTNRTERLALSDDGQRLVICSDKGAQLWSVPEGRLVGAVMVHEEPLTNLALSSDSRRLALFGGNTVSLWDTSSSRQVCKPLRHPLPVSLAVFSPDSHSLVTAFSDNQLKPCEARIWDASTGNVIGRPLAHRDGIVCASFSRDGRWIITGSEDFSARVWDVRTGDPITSPMRHGNQVLAVAFSPDGLSVATAAADGTARVWDAATGEPLTPPLIHPGVLRFAGFSSDGFELITANSSGRIWRWDLHPERRSIDDLRLLSQLLTGFPNTSSKLLNPRTEREPQRVWRRLRDAYPGDSGVSQEEVLDWHSRCAQFSQQHHHWAAAVFHLSHLAQSCPQDAALLDQLGQARESLDEEARR
jgi:WD40 repeat protein